MPRNTKKNNQKQLNAVQIVSAELYGETPQISDSENSKSTRAKFVCNPMLAKMINEANILPVNFELGDDPGTSFNQLPEYIRLFLEDYRDINTSPHLQFSFNNPDGTVNYIYKAIYNLERVYGTREFIKNLINFAENIKKGVITNFYFDEKNNLSLGLEREFQLHNATPVDVSLPAPLTQIKGYLLETEIELDENGVITFRLSTYAEALQGVNISRLRACEICGKFFWAGRKDAYTCSKQHAKTRRMRLLRQNWKVSGDLYLKTRRNKTKKSIK
jgi:hypothetical protein